MSEASSQIVRMLNRSGTNPLCDECGYRTEAIDETRCACSHCGQIIVVGRRVQRRAFVAVRSAFGAVEVVDAGR